MNLDDPRTVFLLAVADDELVTGHRSSHWTGFAPSIESDLAFSTLAQDEINHADLWYQVILAGRGGDLGAVDRDDIDRLGLGREPGQYRHAVVCERPPNDFAYSLARHYLYDHFDAVRLDALTASGDPDVAAVARKLRHEERYHLEHADTWVRRVARASADARRELADGFARVWAEALWLAEPTPAEDAVVGDLVPIGANEVGARWLGEVVPVLEELELPVAATIESTSEGWRIPDGHFDAPRGRHGEHTEDWSSAWEEMTHLHRAHPGASW